MLHCKNREARVLERQDGDSRSAGVSGPEPPFRYGSSHHQSLDDFILRRIYVCYGESGVEFGKDH